MKMRHEITFTQYNLRTGMLHESRTVFIRPRVLTTTGAERMVRAVYPHMVAVTRIDIMGVA